MIVVTTEGVAGRHVAEVLGMVQGSVVRAKNVGRDILSGLKSLVGGELSSYTQLMLDSRAEALNRMTAEAEALGADAVVMTRLATNSVMQGAAEILAYGTAVRLTD